ncbi:MAG: helix-turn-helix transcriptional regulator [Lachnoclostridium sp.]|nr:helix-turn-helix transcriptional regulator [Lachnoclostridium sp.]
MLKRALQSIKERDVETLVEQLAEVRRELDQPELFPDLEGEWNLLMSMRWFLEPEQAIPYLEKARTLIEGHSKVIPGVTCFYTAVYGPLFLFLKEPGTADRIGEQLERMMELYASLLDGVSRCDQLYYAQLAFYRAEFEKAQSFLLKAEGSAKKCGNVLDQICVAEYKARLAIHLSDPVMWNQSLTFICGMQNHEDRVIREVASCIKSKIQMSVGVMSGVPRWIQNGKFGAISDEGRYRLVEDRVSHAAFPLVWFTYTEYLLYDADFYRVINSVDIAAKLYGLDQTLLYESYLWLYKAGAWSEIGDQERTVRYLREAVRCLAPDRLWLFGAEFFPTLGESLIPVLEPMGKMSIEGYRRFSKEYPLKLEGIRAVMSESVFKEPLTEKEQAVARLAALGYKNDEIAAQMFISSNTVKYHLANIYKKLEIKNRVELKNAMEMSKKSEYAYWAELHKK